MRLISDLEFSSALARKQTLSAPLEKVQVLLVECYPHNRNPHTVSVHQTPENAVLLGCLRGLSGLRLQAIGALIAIDAGMAAQISSRPFSLQAIWEIARAAMKTPIGLEAVGPLSAGLYGRFESALHQDCSSRPKRIGDPALEDLDKLVPDVCHVHGMNSDVRR